jgi:hypothetical protein
MRSEIILQKIKESEEKLKKYDDEPVIVQQTKVETKEEDQKTQTSDKSDASVEDQDKDQDQAAPAISPREMRDMLRKVNPTKIITEIPPGQPALVE